MTLKVTLAVAGRVLTQLRRDRRTMAMLLFLPTILMSLFWWMFKDAPGVVFDRIGPGLLALFPFFIMFLVTSVTTLRERSSGTLERLLAMPMGKLRLPLRLRARVRVDGRGPVGDRRRGQCRTARHGPGRPDLAAHGRRGRRRGARHGAGPVRVRLRPDGVPGGAVHAGRRRAADAAVRAAGPPRRVAERAGRDQRRAAAVVRRRCHVDLDDDLRDRRRVAEPGGRRRVRGRWAGAGRRHLESSYGVAWRRAPPTTAAALAQRPGEEARLLAARQLGHRQELRARRDGPGGHRRNRRTGRAGAARDARPPRRGHRRPRARTDQRRRLSRAARRARRPRAGAARRGVGQAVRRRTGAGGAGGRLRRADRPRARPDHLPRGAQLRHDGDSRHGGPHDHRLHAGGPARAAQGLPRDRSRAPGLPPPQRGRLPRAGPRGLADPALQGRLRRARGGRLPGRPRRGPVLRALPQGAAGRAGLPHDRHPRPAAGGDRLDPGEPLRTAAGVV